MKRVLSYIKEFIKPMIIGPSFKVIETFFELLTPYIVARLIDEGIPHQNTQLIYIYGAILILFAVFGYAFTMFCQYLAAKTQENYGTVLRRDLFAHIQQLELAQTQGIGTNSLMTRLTTDIYQIQNAVAMLIRMAPRAPFLLVGSFFMTFLISPKLSLIFLIIIPLFLFIFYFVMSHTIPTYQKIQKKIDDISTLTNESLTGARVIRAFSKQENQYTNFTQETEVLKNFSVFAGKFEAFLNPATQVIINLAISAVIYFGQFEINIGNFTQGEIVAVINYIGQISLALVILANISIIFSRAYTSANRIGEVLDLPLAEKATVPVQTQNPEPEQHVVFDHVTFAYPDAALPILHNINFSIKKGETLGIIGGTGSGKSSLIKLLGRLYDATEGQIIIDDANIQAYPDKQLHKKIQIVFQKATLFSGTIAENLRMGNPSASDELLWQALEIAQAHDFVKEKPEGLDTYIEQGGKNLSGGQRQRLTIARSLVVQPEIIIFDDTSSALDYVTDSRLRTAIRKLSMTSIIVSQRVNAIRDCAQILVLDQGNIIAQGTHDELLATATVYREIAASQKAIEEEV